MGRSRSPEQKRRKRKRDEIQDLKETVREMAKSLADLTAIVKHPKKRSRRKLFSDNETDSSISSDHSRSQSVEKSATARTNDPRSTHIDKDSKKDEPSSNPVDDNDVVDISTDYNDLELLLGSNPAAPLKQGTPLHALLNENWNGVLQKGLEKTERDLIKSKFPVPKDSLLGAPELNLELGKSISSFAKDRDDNFKRMQINMSVPATIIGNLLTSMLNDNFEFNKAKVIKDLSEAGRYLAGTIYSASYYRRKQIKMSITDNDTKEVLSDLPIYPLLFNSDVREKVKQAQALSKQTLKKSVANVRQSTQAFSNAAANKSVSENYKRPPPRPKHTTSRKESGRRPYRR